MKQARAGRTFPSIFERPLAVFFELSVTSFIGFAWAAPIASAVTSVTGAYPRGDAEIFDPGGVMLIETARHVRGALPVLTTTSAVLLLIAVVARFLALAFGLGQLASPRALGLRLGFARATRAFPALLVMGLLALIAYAIVIGLGSLGGGPVIRSLWPRPPSRDIARWGLQATIFVLVISLSAIHDLSRAAIVQGPMRTYDALRAAAFALRRFPLRVAITYFSRLFGSILALSLAAWLGSRVGQKTSSAIALSALIHQSGLAVVGLLRLSWLARAIALVHSAQRPSEHGTSEL